MEWQVDIKYRFILTIHESNWCHGWYATWFFRYIGYRFLLHWIICLLLKSLISLMHWFVFFYRSASSLSIDKIPDRYFLNLYFSMKWCEHNVFFVSAFFHVKSCRYSLYKWIVSSCILKNKSFLNEFVVCFVVSENKLLMVSSIINPLGIKHHGL